MARATNARPKSGRQKKPPNMPGTQKNSEETAKEKERMRNNEKDRQTKKIM